MPPEHAPAHAIDRGSLDLEDARFYARIGIFLVLGLILVSLLVWTGIFGTMLTWGEWGTLTVADLLGFLIIGGILLGVGTFALLFTMRSALRQVEVDLRAADRKVDGHVARLNARVTRTMDEARDEVQAAARAWQNERAEFLRALHMDQETALQTMRTNARTAVARSFADQCDALVEDLAARHPDKETLQGLVAKVDALNERLERLHAEAAVFEEHLDTRTQAAIQAQQKEAEDVRAGLIRARAEIFENMDGHVAKHVRNQVKDSMRIAFEAAFQRRRFYTWLGLGLTAGLLVVVVLAAAGIGGPGLLSAQTAFVALGAAVAFVAGALLILTFSFSDAVRLLKQHLD